MSPFTRPFRASIVARAPASSRISSRNELRAASGSTFTQRYFADRVDGLRPPNDSEELLTATT